MPMRLKFFNPLQYIPDIYRITQIIPTSYKTEFYSGRHCFYTIVKRKKGRVYSNVDSI